MLDSQTKRKETEMGAIGLEVPFRFIRFFAFSATLLATRTRTRTKILRSAYCSSGLCSIPPEVQRLLK
jgi:hypothetical protein